MKAKTLFILLGVLVASGSAVTLWEWDLSQLPSGWTANEYWIFNSSGAHSFVSATAYGGSSEYESSSMVSDTMIVPFGVDTIVVSLISDWEYDGWWTTGESTCSLWFSIDELGGDYHLVEFDSHGWGFGDGSGTTRSATVEIPLPSGTPFYLDFHSSAGASYGAHAHMAWDISEVWITDTDGTAMNRSTWGEIKTVF
ncbi:MAG: hypothetical protein GF388_10285 [Candidatus Aegiribacteria sp.]|nr:hypothetical protein [Candidatus Aegiribacteria sp.]MBD3295419.1 hypothetical protein [Candidatus Fermentibacteria bacterium]